MFALSAESKPFVIWRWRMSFPLKIIKLYHLVISLVRLKRKKKKTKRKLEIALEHSRNI